MTADDEGLCGVRYHVGSHYLVAADLLQGFNPGSPRTATVGSGRELVTSICIGPVLFRDEKAFLVTAALYPALFGDLQAIRLFLLRYAAISREEASERIAQWKSSAAEASTEQPSSIRSRDMRVAR